MGQHGMNCVGIACIFHSQLKDLITTNNGVLMLSHSSWSGDLEFYVDSPWVCFHDLSSSWLGWTDWPLAV